MRPIRLELKGFTAFREKCEVDFSKFDLFAITGQTGAGKTSLLDAMTYALYGKTPRLNKAGKDLISQGATGMSVLLHFRVGGKEYRVARAIKGSTVTARLESLEDCGWKPSSGSINEVNDQIQRIVGLDFGGFTKTVILPQGKFDVFLRGEPKERRAVLEELLDVQVYQRMVKSANEKAKDATIRIEERTANLDANATHEARAAAQDRLEKLTADEATAAALRQKLLKALPVALSLREKREGLTRSQTELEQTIRKWAEINDAAASAESLLRQQSGAIAELDQQMEKTSYDADAHLLLNSLMPQAQRERALSQKLVSERDRLESKLSELDALVNLVEAARRKAKAETEQSELFEQRRLVAVELLKDLQLRHGSADAISLTAANIESCSKEAAGIPAIDDKVRELERRASSLSIEIEAARGSLTEAERALADAEKQYEQLHARDRGAALRHELKSGEPCPVCEQTVQNVPAAPNSRDLAQARARVTEAKAAVKRCENRRLELSTEAQGVPAQIDLARSQAVSLQNRLDQALSRVQMPGHAVEDVLRALRALVNEIKAADWDAQQANERYEAASKKQREAATALQQAEHDRQLKESDAANIDDRIKTLERDLLAVRAALDGAPGLEEMAVKIRALDSAKAIRAELERKRKACGAELKRLEESVASYGKTLAALESQKTRSEAAIQELNKELTKYERQLKTALAGIPLAASPDEAVQIQSLEQSSSKSLEELQGEVQRCRFEVEEIIRRMERNQQLREELERLKGENAIYRDLGSWLNAGNFQQYVLGSAFEILAKEGSKHLHQLSSGRYEFAFEDDEFMVSDHSNADETRSVKTLSGGESFLASLALALALAESITQLNGAHGALTLESLFLDEGFSTLDPETLGKVADAIELLQDGNRLIGIITHVQSLADQMPVRIEIEKTLAGSRIVQQEGNRAYSA